MWPICRDHSPFSGAESEEFPRRASQPPRVEWPMQPFAARSVLTWTNLRGGGAPHVLSSNLFRRVARDGVGSSRLKSSSRHHSSSSSASSTSTSSSSSSISSSSSTGASTTAAALARDAFGVVRQPWEFPCRSRGRPPASLPWCAIRSACPCPWRSVRPPWLPPLPSANSQTCRRV